MSFMLLGILNSQASGGGGASAYDLLETTTLTSTASSVTFSGLGSYSDYAHLQIRAVVRSNRSSVSDNLDIQINSDTGNNYAYHSIVGTGGTVFGEPAGATNKIRTEPPIPASTDPANTFSARIIDILDFSSSSKNTTTTSLQGSYPRGIGVTSGGWDNADAVTLLTLIAQSGSFVSGCRFSLFGIKA